MLLVKSVDGEFEYMLCLPPGLHKSSLVSSPRKMAIGCLQKCLWILLGRKRKRGG